MEIDLKRKETQKEKSAFVLQHERADKEPRTPDHQALDQWKRARRNKKGDRQGHEVHLSICTCVCVCLLDISGEGVKAREQVPIVQLGVMRAVMRVWVSRAAHYKCSTAGPPESRRDGYQWRWSG